MNMKLLDKIFEIILIIGGLNWGIVGFSDFDFIAYFLGEGSGLTRALYCLIGIAALYHAVLWHPRRKRL